MRAEIDLLHLFHAENSAEAFCLQAKEIHQLGAENAFRKAGIVFHVRGDRELTAGLQPFQNERSEIGAGEIDRRRTTGGAGSDDDHTIVSNAFHYGDFTVPST